jgi:hypothetical protein
MNNVNRVFFFFFEAIESWKGNARAVLDFFFGGGPLQNHGGGVGRGELDQKMYFLKKIES